MGEDECYGDQRYGGTQTRAKGRHKWPCRGMNQPIHGQWPGKFPPNTDMVSDGMWGTRIGADGHGWVYEGANECIRAGGHEKKAKRATNGCGCAETDSRSTSENCVRNRYTHSSNRREQRRIWGTEGDGDDPPGGLRKPGTRTHEKERAKTAETRPNLNKRTTSKMTKNAKIIKWQKKQ